MVRIQRNASIVSFPSIDDPVVKRVIRDYATDTDSGQNAHFEFDGVLDGLLDDHFGASEDDRHKIGEKIVALQSFMTTHNLELSDLVWYWW